LEDCSCFMPTVHTRSETPFSPQSIGRDFVAGVVVFLVALPLCLGIALASGAPLFSGILAGIVGGIVVGSLSGSHTSVSGPAAGLTVIVATQIATLGSFDAFLLAVAMGGAIQIAFGLAKGGFIASFVPSSVIKGLLTAIGLILIIDQTPYVLGRIKPGTPADSLHQLTPSHPNIFDDVGSMFSGPFDLGAMIIGVASITILIGWDKISWLKKSMLPASLVVVVLAIAAKLIFGQIGGQWQLGADWLVRVPASQALSSVVTLLTFPDFSRWLDPAIYIAAITIAIVASLETLLNLEAVDNLDPKRRSSPANRELFAQGVGNLTSGLIGGLPITSVIVRGSVNISAGGQTRLSAILHGLFLAGAVLFFDNILNLIPLSCLAAILVATGFKLANPKLIHQVWSEGRYQFLPYIITVIAIVTTNLLIGIIIGLVVGLGLILLSNYKRPVQMIIEKHLGGELYHLQLANQVSFLNRAAIDRTLNRIPSGAHLLIDACTTDYMDPDILSLIKDYAEKTAPVRGVDVSLKGFKPHHKIVNEIRYVDYSSRELQGATTPAQVLDILEEGNQRFRNRHPLPRDLMHQVNATAQQQSPLAIVLSCMDSRTPTEIIFDLGLGDVLNICLAGNAMVGPRVLASIEFGCTDSGAKLIVVMAHTGSPVMRQIVKAVCAAQPLIDSPHGEHFPYLVENVTPSIMDDEKRRFVSLSLEEQQAMCDQIARRHIMGSIETIRQESETLARLLDQRQVGMIAAMYDTKTGKTEFIKESAIGFETNGA